MKIIHEQLAEKYLGALTRAEYHLQLRSWTMLFFFLGSNYQEAANELYIKNLLREYKQHGSTRK